MTTTLPATARTLAYLDGAFVPAADGETFASLDPTTGEHLADIAACGPEDVDRAVASARTAFEAGTWSRLEPRDRRAILLRLADLLEQHGEDLAQLESLDAGKPIVDCRGFDLPDAIGSFRWYAEAIDKVFGATAPTGPDAIGMIVTEPVGVVGAVLPWNFPLAMLAWKIAPALAAGNSVVVKPPELTTLTTLRLAELATEAGVPDGVLNIVPGLGHVTGRALGLHGDVDAISFTGSVEVGREFLRCSADSNLKQIVLEMGGKSPQIVTADNGDRLPLIAEDLAEAAFFNMGQNCSAGSRILVHRSLLEEFADELVAVAEQAVIGDPRDPGTTLGPLIEADALDRVTRCVDEAVAAGAVARTGGSRVLEDTGGYFYPPTVLTSVSPDMPVAREEIFGPVVALIGFDTVAEAIEIANDSPYGLAATVWSHDVDAALRIAREVRAGTVGVNGYSEGDISTPFGGYKLSGFGGRDNGLEALRQYTETKTIWITLR